MYPSDTVHVEERRKELFRFKPAFFLRSGVHEVQSTLDHFRDNDCELLKRFRVAYICDFMLEYRKMKYRLPVTSSEKADSHRRYHDFDVLALPYPGSEFFRVWRDSEYAMTDLVFDWEQDYCGTSIDSYSHSFDGIVSAIMPLTRCCSSVWSSGVQKLL
ncbi:hypothetical protein X801_00043 [Opisthorchis viverrini]|uniref:Uncharacterized protein n=1 Tax=Opisthorchis viverrini TaxID=6198 RepID=A0A1S8XBG0_OPIVI|nr:hypothetical protein X801_00043 [Opisthorchis viverrini]